MKYYFVTAVIDGGKPVAPEQLSNKQRQHNGRSKKKYMIKSRKKLNHCVVVKSVNWPTFWLRVLYIVLPKWQKKQEHS